MIGPLRSSRRSRLPGHRSRRRLLTAAVVAALAVVATGCQSGDGGDHDDDARGPVTLVVSEAWVQSQQGGGGGGAFGGGDVQARIEALQVAVDRLRDETRSGWVGRQDDVTGYLGDLSGGSWAGGPADFMDAYGADLFGVDTSTLRFGEVDTDTVPGVSTTRVTQALGDVPVLDAGLVLTGRGSSATTDGQRVNSVRGRVFPGLTVTTTPVITAEQASAAAAEAAGGTADGAARLVVLPTGAGVLAWEVVVVAGTTDDFTTGLYFIDATTGVLVSSRPLSAEVAPPLPKASAVARAAEPDPSSVEVTGQDALGRDRTAYGLQTPGGVELTDTTTGAWDPGSRTGGAQTYDGSALQSPAQLPGELVTSRDTTIRDADALAAQSYSGTILAYYESLGRDSWDDQGGSLVSTVHFGGESYCNASFFGSLREPQMVYGDPCVLDGEQQAGTFVEPDIAAHEITHGVTATSAGLLYTGQSGALNESFSDYFGNVVGDRIHGSDSSALGEDSCSQVPAPTRLCVANADGTTSFRNMLNGNDFDEYLRILNPGQRLQLLIGYRQDYGGVHFNSAIWNNALWSIRTRLAQIDGEEGRTSPLAQDFDRAVYGALATRLTPASGFLDARAAVEQVITDSGLDPVIMRTAREVFDQNKICAGCPETGELAGDAVDSSPQTQLHPVISGDRVAWLDLTSGLDFAGYAASTTLGGDTAPSLSAGGEALDVVFAGDALLALDFRGRIQRIDLSGSTVLGTTNPDAAQAAGLAGSDAGAAWLSGVDTVSYVDSIGVVTELRVPGLRGDTITSLGAGGGSVVAGTDQGKVYVWSGSGDFRQVGQLGGAVLSAATYGGNVFVIDDTSLSTLITADGQTAGVTQQAAPFGATMSGQYAVWAEAVGGMESGVAPGGRSPYPDTDLYLLSLETGKVYDLHPAPAQQGFPSMSGNQLVWQDATFGGDDVFTASVPEGL